MSGPRFPITTRATFTKASGAAPNSELQATIEEARLLIATKDAVAPALPSNTAAPVLSGTAAVGQTLSCTLGTWTGSNLAHSRVWQANYGAGWVDIPSGNGGSTFVLTSAQVGAQIRCLVRAINGAGRMVVAPSNASSTVS